LDRFFGHMPEEPFYMLLKHWGGFTMLTSIAIGLGMVFVFWARKRVSYQAINAMS
jgi:hypothetical protein